MGSRITRTGWVAAVVVLGACGGGSGVDDGNGALAPGSDAGILTGDSGSVTGATGMGGSGQGTTPNGQGGVTLGVGDGREAGATGQAGGTGGVGAGAAGGGGVTGAGGVSSSGTGSGSTGAGANGNSGSGHGAPVTGVLAVTGTNACAQQSASTSMSQLDMLIIEDNTKSMEDKTSSGSTKWEMATSALSSFVKDPKSAGIEAGIEFYAGESAKDCTVSTYETPVVAIAPLSGNAEAIIKAIQNAERGSYTPTPAALQGGLNYAKKWASAHPTHKVIIVLATDGLPNRYPNAAGNACSGTGTQDATALQRTLDAAKAGVAGSPAIPTYVIGVMAPSDGASQSNLNSIAKSGNTGSAFIVDTAANAAAQFSNAMNVIREANQVACEFAIPAAPSDKWIDFSQVSVVYGTSGGTESALPWVGGSSSCTSSSGGFYYDNNSAPTKVTLCPTSCSKVQADSSASLKVLFACMMPAPDGGTPSGEGGVGGASGSPNGAGGAGGNAGGGHGGESVAPACLLTGQSCSSSSECCGGYCNGSYCGAIIN